jgi:hypothetical protein
LIESFCVHARNLIEFFQENHRRYTDGSYQPFSTAKQELDTVVLRLNNQISHLKIGRTIVTSDKIDIKERAKILNMLSREIAQFKAHLTGGYKNVDIPVPPQVATPEALGSGANTTSSVSISIAGPFFPRIA